LSIEATEEGEGLSSTTTELDDEEDDGDEHALPASHIMPTKNLLVSACLYATAIMRGESPCSFHLNNEHSFKNVSKLEVISVSEGRRSVCSASLNHPSVIRRASSPPMHPLAAAKWEARLPEPDCWWKITDSERVVTYR
jgi:hypothetical protein